MRKGTLVTLVVFFLAGTVKAQAEEFRFKPPVNLGVPINTGWMERDPFITANGQKLFFVSDRPGGIGGADIWMSTWNGTNWGNPVNLGPNINSGLDDWSPSVSPDGQKLYFITYGRPGGYGGWDVWVSTFNPATQQWGPAEDLGPVINSFKVDWCPELSRDGQSLYYTTNSYYHPRGQALFVSRWNGAAWQVPEALPLNVNNTGTEERPTLTADEQTMYFVRWNYVQNIFVSQKDVLGDWAQPVQLDSMVNYPGFFRTSDPAISSDGKKLFFSSTRPGGMSNDWWDIWVAERVVVPKVPALSGNVLLVLACLVALAGLLWIRNLEP